MLSSKWSRWLLVGGAALGALAAGCAEEDPGTPPPVNGTDAGLDSGLAGDSGMCQTVFGYQGVLCTTSTGTQGYQLCTNGVPGGPCNSLTGGDGGFTLPEGGFQLPDGGFQLPEGGFQLPEGGLGDSGITIDDSGIPSAKCPAPYQCTAMAEGSLVLSQIGFANVCADSMNKLPTCTATADCTAKGISAGICVDVAMLAGPELAGLAGIIGLPPKFCGQKCTP